MTILGPILLVQFIVIVIIAVVLKNVLDNMLIDTAIKQLGLYVYDKNKNPNPQIIVIGHKNLGLKLRDMVQKVVVKKFGPAVAVQYEKDSGILGGLIIRINESKIDYSLRLRLKQGGFLK